MTFILRMLGNQRRLVTLWAWLILWPNWLLRLHTSQARDMVHL